MLPLVIRPEAQADMLEARDWYNRQRAGLGEQFVEDRTKVMAVLRGSRDPRVGQRRT